MLSVSLYRLSVFLNNHISDLRMPETIRSEDCPPGLAPCYPGKKSKNNPNGTDLSRSEFADKVITDWVKYFTDKESYKRTPWAHKSRYLLQYMKPLGVGYQTAKTKLLDIERKLAEVTEDEELTSSQSLHNPMMEIDTEKVWSDMSRRVKDSEIDKWLNLSDKEIFEDKIEVREDVKNSYRYKAREKAYYLALSDTELFERYEAVSHYIRNLEEFKQRHRQFVENYMDDKFAQSSSQEILEKLSQTPASVQNSETYMNRLRHLSYEERSEKLVMKNIKDTINELNKTPTGRKQAKAFIAGVSHPVYGDPGLGLTRKAKGEVKNIKGKLLSGSETTLKVDNLKVRKISPQTVETIAREHWLENTIPEPAKHTGKAIEEGGETVPTRYQDRTDREVYENFKEDCSEKVKVEMAKVGQEMRNKLVKRIDSVDKQRRLEYAGSLPELFPSLDWFIKQRPAETKPLCDHTTGLCHLCEAARKNFSTIVQAAKTRCSCNTRMCPNWSCVCPVVDDDQEQAPCVCPPCECEDCVTCQVNSDLCV